MSASAITVTLFAPSADAPESLLARANVRFRELDLTIRDFTIWRSTREGREGTAYVTGPARKYQRGGKNEFYRYLSGDGLQAINNAILRKFRSEGAPEGGSPEPRQERLEDALSDDDVNF